MTVQYQSAWAKQAAKQKANMQKKVPPKTVKYLVRPPVTPIIPKQNITTLKKVEKKMSPGITKLNLRSAPQPVEYSGSRLVRPVISTPIPERYPGSEIAQHLGLSKKFIQQHSVGVTRKPAPQQFFYTKTKLGTFKKVMVPRGMDINTMMKEYSGRRDKTVRSTLPSYITDEDINQYMNQKYMSNKNMMQRKI